jgi:hypothetical protein
MAALADSERAPLCAGIDQPPAGGEIPALIGAVLVVLIIPDYLGVTQVFHRRWAMRCNPGRLAAC